MSTESIERRGGKERETEADALVPGETHQVLINTEEQQCLWPAEKEAPAGWTQVFTGGKQECLDYVAESWTDMRPKSTRTT